MQKKSRKNPITSRFFIDFQCATSAQKSTCTHSDRKRISTLQQLKLLTTFFHRFYYPIFGQCKREAVFSICTIFNFIRTSLENACNKCSNFIETKNRIWRRIEFERFEMRRNQIRSLNGMIDIYANVESIHTCFRHCTQFTRREHFNACIKKKQPWDWRAVAMQSQHKRIRHRMMQLTWILHVTLSFASLDDVNKFCCKFSARYEN